MSIRSWLFFIGLLVVVMLLTTIAFAVGGITLGVFAAMCSTTLGAVHGIGVGKALAEREIQEIKATVWDEAYGTGIHDEFQSQEYDGGRTPPARINPYRELKF